MPRLIRRFPFLSWGVVSIALLVPIEVFVQLGTGYDDGGFGSAGFLLGLAWAWFAFPFHLASEALFELNGGRAHSLHDVIAFGVGGTFFVAAELVLQFARRRRGRKHAT